MSFSPVLDVLLTGGCNFAAFFGGKAGSSVSAVLLPSDPPQQFRNDRKPDGGFLWLSSDPWAWGIDGTGGRVSPDILCARRDLRLLDLLEFLLRPRRLFLENFLATLGSSPPAVSESAVAVEGCSCFVLDDDREGMLRNDRFFCVASVALRSASVVSWAAPREGTSEVAKGGGL